MHYTKKFWQLVILAFLGLSLALSGLISINPAIANTNSIQQVLEVKDAPKPKEETCPDGSPRDPELGCLVLQPVEKK